MYEEKVGECEMEIDEKDLIPQKSSSQKTTLDKLDEEYGDKNCSFAEVEQIGKAMIAALPKINFNKIRNEMEHMQVDVYENPTTFQITESMAKVQQYKNRLSEIASMVEHEYMTRKRVNDILFDANQAVSKQSSADKRRGEATLRFPILLLRFTDIESFRYEVTSKMNNVAKEKINLIINQVLLSLHGKMYKKLAQHYNFVVPFLLSLEVKMMLKLTVEEDFMNARLKYDAVQKAIKKAEILRLSPIECQPLFAEKYKLQDDFKTKKEKVIAAQINNIVNLNDGWYGILYKNGKKTEMLVSPLNSEHLDSIKIDFTTDRLKERDEYTQFVNDNFNQTILNKYMNKVQRKADEYLKQFFDCQDTIRKNDKTYFLTYHCIKRWNERVNNSNDKFDVNQRQEIVSNIESSFKKSNCVYYMEETETEYYLNQEDMVLFVITNDDVIATLWVNNFGF